MIINTSNRISHVKPYYFATKLAEIAHKNNSGADIINLGIGSPDLSPPDEVVKQIQSATAEEGAYRYQPYRGISELRSAFAEYYQRHYEVSINDKTEVLPLIGSKEGIMHISMAFCEAGDQVLIPDPGYPSYRTATLLSGATPVTYDLTADRGWLPDLAALECRDLSKVKIMWINYPHMPTGASVNIDDLNALISFAKRNSILLCHDNPYTHIQNEKPLSIFNGDGAKECCLELCSLSKTFNMAGCRVGALIGKEEYIDAVLTFKSNMDSGMFKPLQSAAAVALRQPAEWYAHINEHYYARKKWAYLILDELKCTYATDQAGMFVWAKVPDHIEQVEQWIDHIIDEAGVFITPGFIFGKNGDRYVRISLCADVDTLKESLHRIRTRL